MNSASTLLLCRSAVLFSASFLVSVSQPESLRQSLSRVLVALLLIQPMLVNAAPFVRGGEATAQRGVAWIPETVETKAAETSKPIVEKAVGIDEWMAQNNLVPAHSKREVEPIISKPLPFSSLINSPAFTFAAATDEVRFTATPSAISIPRNSTGSQTITVTNQGPATATNAITTYTPPTTTGVTVSSVNASPGGACVLGSGVWTCPSVSSMAVSGTIVLTVNFSISSTATLGATVGGKVKVVSGEYNPSAGESLYRTWGSNNINETLAGNMFWAGYTGTTSPGVYTGAARDEGTNIFTAWAISAANPTGAYTTANEPVNSNNAIWGTSGTGYGPLLQSVVTTPPTISLPQTNNNINNRRAWEIRTGIFLNSATTIYTCVTSSDDGAYIMIDGTSVASTNNYTAGTLVNTGTALTTGYHSIVYRILNRNTDGAGGEASAGGFGALGIGTSSAGCTSANYVILSSVQPETNVTIVAASPIITGFKSVKLTTDADSSGSITAGDTLNYTLQYVNAGGSVVPNFQITDLLPAGISVTATGAQTVLVSGSGTSASANTGYTGGIGAVVSNLLASGATLAIGGVITVTIPVRVNAGATGTILNQASGNGTGLSSSVLTDNAGTTSDLPSTVTAAPYNLTIPASSVAQTITGAVDGTTFTVASVATLSLAGKVFEDVNYGGGAGRDLLTSGGIVRTAARVELYNAAGAFVSFTTTNGTGDYSFTGLTAGNYTVRVASRTVSSSRIGWVATVLGVQTYRTTADTGATFSDINRVGGEKPSVADAVSGTVTTVMNTATGAFTAGITGQANSISPVTLGATSITGIDFGFNFDTIVNTNQAGIGSFRQFIFNSNFLDNGSIAQVGQTPGKETSIFMISDGQAHPGVRAGLLNMLSSNGVAVIVLPSTLTITDEDTTVDGKTQTANIGNTNSAVLGTGGIVGTDSLSLPMVNGPEVEFTGTNLTNVGIETQSPRTTLRGFAMWGFGPVENDPAQADIRILITDDAVIEECVLGSAAHSFTDPGADLRSGSSHIYIAGDGINRLTTIRNNLIGFAGGRGITALNGNPNLSITGNEIRRNNRSDGNQGGGIELRELTSVRGSISGNLITDHKPPAGNENGLEIVNLTNPGSYSTLGVDNNTFTLNSRGVQIAASASSGIVGVTVSHNLLFNNSAGVMINSDGAASGSVSTVISKNSTYNNSGLGIDLRDIGPSGVTANDGVLITNFGNAGTDYPIITSATLEGSTLKVKGYVGSNPAGNSTFAAADIELFVAADDGNNNGNTIVGDGLSKAHGEGKTYLGPIVADGNGLFDATMNVSGISVGEFVTATTRVAFKTSEFSSNRLVTIPIDVVGFKSILLTTDADTTSSITPGDTLTYTIQYVNTGNNPLNNFEITDVLPAGLTITGTGNQTVSVNSAGTSATKNASYTGGVGATVSNLLSAGAVIAAGGVVTVTIPVTVNPGFSGTITNQASATGTGLDSPVLTDNAGATADLPATVTATPYNVTIPGGSVAQSVTPTVDATTFSVSSSADLKLTKTAPTSVQAGSSMTYTLSLSNVGGASTSGTTSVKDTLPTGVIVNSGASGSVALSGAQAANWTCNSDASAPQSITCTSTTAIAATSGTSVFAFDVNVAATLTADIVNQAKVFGGGDPGKPAVTSTGAITDCTAVSENTAGNAVNAGCAYESTPVVNIAAFKSVKLTTDADSSGTITAGDTLTWTVQYKNTGSADVTTFQLNDQLPGGTTITATGGQTVTVIGTTAASNNSSYTGAASGAVADLLSTTTTFKTGDILKVDIPVTVNSGFTGSLSNQVTGTGGNLSVAGVKTDNVDSTTAGLPSGVTIPTGSVVQTQTGTVDPTVVTVGSAVNVEAYKSVKLITDADASGGISPGDTLNYTIHYINLGPLVSNFQINDPLPTGITIAATGGQTVLAAGGGTGGTKNPAYTGAASGALSDLIAAGANLNTDGAVTITIPVTINAGFTGTIANQATGFGDQIPPVGIKTDNAGQTSDMSATVTAAPYNMSIPAGSIAQTIAGTVDPTTFVVLAVTAPSLTLRKSVTPTGDQLPGTELAYSITFTNTGGSLAREVVLTDPIPFVTDFKIGSVTTDPGSTGLTIVVEYSNDYVSATPTAATWTYTPVSGGGGATTNFDRDVKAVRWRVTAGFLSSITPDNSGEVGFTVIIR